MWPPTARIAQAMARSKPGPALRIDAGARLTVTRLRGNSKPELRIAARTRSRASRTARSPSPTIVKFGKPVRTSTSTVTRRLSTPWIAKVVTWANMPRDATGAIARRDTPIATIARRLRGGAAQAPAYLRTTTTRTRRPAATRSSSVAVERSHTALVHGTAASAGGVARQAQARSRPLGARLARRSVMATERVRAPARRTTAADAVAAGPTVAVAS